MFKNPPPHFMPIKLPCGQCVGCRLARTGHWALRCLHESMEHDENSFLTVTYDDESLPDAGTLVVEHHQQFMKRLRHEFKHLKIRFYMCGEYGDLNGRPHYHYCLFGLGLLDLDDIIPESSDGDIRRYISPTLDFLWRHGRTVIQDFTPETAAYTARYVMKKINGKDSMEHYCKFDPDTGEVIEYRLPEFTCMSRRPGIGSSYIEKYHPEVYQFDEVIFKGRPIKPPKYYDRRYEIENETHMKQIKADRKAALDAKGEESPERLMTREKFHKLKLKHFEKRKI